MLTIKGYHSQNSIHEERNKTMTNELTELTKTKRGLMRGLHLVYDFNFEKPYRVAKVCTPTTVGAMRKAVAADKNDIVVALAPSNWFKSDNISAVELDPLYSQGFDTDRAGTLRRYGINSRDAFDNYYTKKDFSEKRSASNFHIIVVAQSREYFFYNTNSEAFKSRRENASDSNETPVRIRHRVVKTINRSYGREFEYCRIDANRYDKNVHFTIYHDDDEVLTDIMDKSGYLIKSYRDALHKRAEDRKAEIKKQEFLKMDYSDRIVTLREVIRTKQNALADALRFANTSKALEKVRDDLSYWNGLLDVMRDFEEFVENVENKSFASIEACDALYNRILNNAINGRH